MKKRSLVMLASATVFASYASAVDVSIIGVTATDFAMVSGGSGTWDMHQGVYVDQQYHFFPERNGSFGVLSTAGYGHWGIATGDVQEESLAYYSLSITFTASQPVNTVYKVANTSQSYARVFGNQRLLWEDASGYCTCIASAGASLPSSVSTEMGTLGAIADTWATPVAVEYFIPVTMLYENTTTSTTWLPVLGLSSTTLIWAFVEVPPPYYPGIEGGCREQFEDMGRVVNGRVPKLPPPTNGGQFPKDFRSTAALAEWRTPNTTTVFGYGLITELPNGDLPIGCEGDGTYDLSIKPRGCLRMTNQMTVSSNSLTGPQLDFIRGDINEDNYIGTDDYLILSEYFDKVDTDSDWFFRSDATEFSPYDADLNGDGTVGTDDYVIMSDNWDLVGDD